MSYNFTNGAVQYLSSIYTQTANIKSFDVTTNTLTLETPIDVSLGYNSVIGDVTSQYTISGTSLSVAQAINNGTSAQLSTDETGNFVGVFNVPSTTFQTGSRVFRVDNRGVLTDPTTATAYAEATFTASGLATTSQQLDFSPSIDSSASTFTSVSQQNNVPGATIKTTSPWDPIAQTFIIDSSNYPNGMFIISAKIFFQSKPSTNVPVTLSIIPTLNGSPNGKALDYSTVTLTADQVVTSKTPHYLDSTTFTEFMFQAPVYIQPGVLYAILLKSNSPDYTVYYAQQNQIAVPSTAKPLPSDTNPTSPTKIGTAPYVGALFESQNSITWTADQTKDLMFVIDRCVFDTTQTPQINFNVLEGIPYRKLGKNDLQHSLNTNTVSNLMGNFVNGNMRADAFNLTTTDFVPTSSTIDYEYSATLMSGNTTVGPYPVTPGKFGSPNPTNISLGDGQGERVLLSSVNTSFYLTATMSSADANVSPIISDDGVSLYNLRYIINNMGIGNNVISVANTGYGYNANTIAVTVSNPDIGSNVATVGLTMSGNTVQDVYVISPGSGYLKTPTITITGSNTYPAVVNVYGETGQHGGNSYARYFTKKVVMTPGNDSGDLRVYLTAYQPSNTGIYVYYKILSSQDTQQFDQGSWQLMTPTTSLNTYSSSPTDYISYEYAPGVYGSGVANNNISYLSTNGQTYNNFIQFAIKIVMATSDNTIVPTIQNLQALALPPGTGM